MVQGKPSLPIQFGYCLVKFSVGDLVQPEPEAKGDRVIGGTAIGSPKIELGQFSINLALFHPRSPVFPAPFKPGLAIGNPRPNCFSKPFFLRIIGPGDCAKLGPGFIADPAQSKVVQFVKAVRGTVVSSFPEFMGRLVHSFQDLLRLLKFFRSVQRTKFRQGILTFLVYFLNRPLHPLFNWPFRRGFAGGGIHL